MKARCQTQIDGHSHLIVSEDSDALLLAMTAAPADTFVLSSKLVFSVRSFNRRCRPAAAGRGAGWCKEDFVALAVMMGNDYLPGSRFGVKYSEGVRAAAQRREVNKWTDDGGEGGGNAPSPSSSRLGTVLQSLLPGAGSPRRTFVSGERRPGKMRRSSFGESRVYEEGKLAPPALRKLGDAADFARITHGP